MSFSNPNDDGFTFVGRGHKLCAGKRKKSTKYSSSVQRVIDGMGLKQLSIDSLKESVDIKPADDFLNLFVNILKEKVGDLNLELVIYGLGNISSSEDSRRQLGFLFHLRERLSEYFVLKIYAYDPVFTSDEMEWLEERDIEILANELGIRRVSVDTVFLMFHCGGRLYNNVLYANWAPDRLRRLFILGNSFSTIVDVWSLWSKRDLEQCQYIHAAAGLCVEHKLNMPDDDYAFNHTSLHYFDRNVVLPFKRHDQAPRYDDDPEMIE